MTALGQLRTPAATLSFARFRGQIGRRFRAAGCLFLAKRRHFENSPRGFTIGDTVAEDEYINSDTVNVPAQLEILAEQGWPAEKVNAPAKLNRRGLVVPNRQVRAPTRGPRRACRPR